MTQLSSFLSEASILKNYVPGERASIAIKGDSQIFSASLNVVKTGPIYHGQNFFKILNISSCTPFKVLLLLLNEDESLLAVVGESSIVIVDVKSVDFDSSEPVWDCFDVSITIPKVDGTSCSLVIKDIVWHPASSTKSELVVLTEDEILLYDIVFSLTQPILTLALNKSPQLTGKKVLSICFGSAHNFAGSITLYLSTNCGQIYGLYPFLHKSSKLGTSKRLLSKFVEDWDLCFQSYESRIPPSAAFALYCAVFTKHSELVRKVEAALLSPLFSEADANQILSLSIDWNESSPELLGPLATLGPNLKLTQTSSNTDVLVLAGVYSDHTGNITISHLSQIIPLTISLELSSLSLSQPLMPVKKPAQPKELSYSQPPRGFGYVIDSEDDEDQENEDFELHMQTYREELELYNAKDKINRFIDSNFNKLSVVATDSTDLKFTSNTESLFQNLRESQILVALGTSLIIGDLAQAVSEFLGPECSAFDVLYKLIKTNSIATSFARVEDRIEGTGGYLLACSATDNAEVFQVKTSVRPESRLKLEPKDAAFQTKPSSSTRHTALPAAELSMIKADGAKPLMSAQNIDPTQAESLRTVHQITADLIRKIGSLTKFILALQMKIEIQFKELKDQTKDLLLVKENTAKKEHYNKNRERIGSLIERQESLITRAECIRHKIVERFEKARAAQKLPLSLAEIEWFKELNSITKTVTLGDKTAPSMKTRVERLQAEVQILKDRKQSQPSEENLNEMLSSLLLRSDLVKVALALALEGDLLEHSKITISACFKRLQDVASA
ncbi:hypothetical protein METBIDRAFT_208871 [Metschnikowia bicuspidata var. bicuspidata NRRL YB-4993]|uniref:Uncharacterized protein n=1 Tax=Metschnikowia bicuspidata var. bicuspidata NRRL YB-4993 TaxID=869754 RepID=A0A1A0H6Y6_9ASCO|nr:hypothetical protein METBIDRAFT_208871 [Metschnikowia bicuspidata var. bicuspidata NRRL YB-4993]OBA19859.1 hypothetical protein METBIDRAFT_208871 [Metschnikowia bicuspidata var. bicuspidata NRRL YB-4993]